MALHLSNLELVRICDSFPQSPPTDVFEFRYRNSLLGYVRESVARALDEVDGWDVDSNQQTIGFGSQFDSLDKRSQLVKETVTQWRKDRRFAVLEKWRDELYSVYAPSHHVLFTMERSASPLFGVATFGVHMIAYLENPFRIWCPKRAQHKSYGGKRDNTVAGGIAHGYGIFETLAKECGEEAGLDPGFVKAHAKSAGVISYHYVREQSAGGETGLFQPEYEFLYDLKLDESITPEPNDDEVERFDLWTVEQVQQALANGEFKANCAVATIDFLIRHGVIDAGSEPDLIEILAHSHRSMEFPTL